MKNIAITGAAGYIGTLLLKKLLKEPEVEHIIGLDVKEPPLRSTKFTYIKHDVRQPFGDTFIKNKIDTAIHLAFVVVPIHDEKKSHQINIEGSRNLLDASLKAGVKQIYYMGSNTEYGAHDNNPLLFTEEMALNPNSDYPYACDKAEVERLFQEFAKHNPDVCVTIGHTAAVTGPCGDACGLTELFLPVMVKSAGKDPLWQFIHEDDLAELVILLLKQRKKGIYNLAGDGGLIYSQMIKMTGKPSITLPAWLLYWGVRLSWDLHLQSKSQAGGFNMLKYPVTMSNDKVKRETGYKLHYTGQEAFETFLRTRGNK
jgi:UDP-glucose 4-epimerase